MKGYRIRGYHNNEKVSSISVVIIELIYLSVPKVGEGMRGIVILARCEFHFIREHKNLV